jgi:hypothetical protein
VRDARDPLDPRANEIDMRFRPLAGVSGSTLTRCSSSGSGRLDRDPPRRRRVQRGATSRRPRRAAGGERGLDAGACDMVDMRNIFEVMSIVVEPRRVRHRTSTSITRTSRRRRRFTEFQRHVEILRGLLGERKNNARR